MVVVRTNQSALDFYTNLAKLGMDAVIIPGTYNKQEHEKEYVERILKAGDTLRHLLEATPTLNAINSDCLFQIYHKTEKEEGTLPCAPVNRFRLLEEEKEGIDICPFLMECGLMKPFLEMNKKPIWITTPYALKSTSIPRFLDDEGRTLQEVTNDLIDIVFFDEVDEVMNVYDADSVQETIITGGLHTLNPVLQMDTRRTLYSSQRLYSNVYINEWIEHLHHTDISLNMLHQLLENHLDFKYLFENKVLNIYQLGNRLLEYVQFSTPRQKEYYQEILFQYLAQAVHPSHPRAVRFINNFENARALLIRFTTKREEKRQAVRDFFKSMRWKINLNMTGKHSKVNDAEERAELTFELFTYLYYFEEHFRMLVRIYPIVKSQLRLNDGKMNYVLGVRNKLFRLLEATPTGHRFGYRLHRNMDKGIQQISIIRYNGQTRKLLTDWHQKFNFFKWKYNSDGSLEKVTGPTLIGLSGTAYVPGSPHFHVPFEKVYKLKNKLSPSKVNCFTKFIPSLDEKYDYLFISGANEEMKMDNLMKMASECWNSIENQLAYWESSGENRKVLIVTTSYEDTRIVANTFAMSKVWRGRFGFLSRKAETKGELKEAVIHPSDVEIEVPKREIDVLIAPITVISRGYNILQKNSPHSYFGSLFVFVRPYYVVGDMENLYKLLHGQIDRYIREIQHEDKRYAEFVKKLHQKSQGKLQYLLTNPFFGITLSNYEMEELCLYTLVMIQQTLGRLMRGDTDANLIIVDAKMHYHSEEFKEQMERKNKETSMMNVWTRLLNQYEKNEIMIDCFGSLKEGLNEIKELNE